MTLSCARWLGLALVMVQPVRGEELIWRDSGPGVAVTCLTNSTPVIFTVVRIEREQFKKDLVLSTILGSNTVVGLETLSNSLRVLPKELGTPVAAMNADFFMMTGSTKGDPRGLHIWRGELVSTPFGPAAFWHDTRGEFHGEKVESKLTISWPGGGTNAAGLNEMLGVHPMVLFTPTLGRLYDYKPPTNRNTSTRPTTPRPVTNNPATIPQGGFVRPPGGQEWTLEPIGVGPWLPLRVGQTYRARTVKRLDGFTNVPPNLMLMMLGSNLVATLPEITNGTPVTITVATDPDLRGVDTAIGTGPMLVRNGVVHETTTRMSQDVHPRSALGWNDQYLFLAVADGRQADFSVGLRLPEMAEFLVQLGCREAINMDGGLSTILMLNGETINHPSNGAKNPKNGPRVEGFGRDIANAILILRKRAADENPD